MRSPLDVPTRIAFAGDWNANRMWAVGATSWAGEHGADVILHCGGFGYLFQPAYLSALTTTLTQYGMHLLFVDGNNEDHRWLLRQKLDPATGLRPLSTRIWHVPRGFRWQWGGVRFLGLGGAHSVDGVWRRERGQLWQKEERITDVQADEICHGGRADVMVSHDCPAGVAIPGLVAANRQFPMIEKMRANEHRALLRQVVDVVQPRMIWHGHYHLRYQTFAELGYDPVHVTGLDCDGGQGRPPPFDPFAANMQVVDLTDLQELVL